MKIITFVAIKGGVGKTTLTYNFGEWLAANDKKVLLIDTDPQSSLSQTYNIYQPKLSLLDIFTTPKIKPSDVIVHQQNLDILPSNMLLDEIQVNLETKINKEFLIYTWLYDNYDYLKQYEYILFDCHPGFSLITRNTIVTSDLIISPIEPNSYSFNSKAMLDVFFNNFKTSLINPKTHQSYINTKLRFVGNRLTHSEISNNFVKKMKENATLGYIYYHDLINQSTLFSKPVSSMTKANKQKLTDVFETFNNIKNEL